TSTLLQMDDQTIVVDCGIGVSRSLVEAGVSLLDLDAIFITHLHSDHVLELGPLLYTAWTTGLSTRIKLYGPLGIEEYWEAFLASMAFDQAIRIDDEGRTPIRELVELTVFGEGAVVDLGGTSVSALRVEHPPVTECYALKFAGPSKTVVFSADTCYFPPLAAFARGADYLIHEAMLTDGVESLIRRTAGAKRLREHLMASHTPASDVGKIARSAEVKTLILNHLVPADDPNFGDEDWRTEVAKSWDGPTIVGKDGLCIKL
ncbi:MAG: MBL fold metallo-hydrolase, partial [Pseudomonadota bacterium]